MLVAHSTMLIRFIVRDVVLVLGRTSVHSVVLQLTLTLPFVQSAEQSSAPTIHPGAKPVRVAVLSTRLAQHTVRDVTKRYYS
jgi:hypothetical protein